MQQHIITNDVTMKTLNKFTPETTKYATPMRAFSVSEVYGICRGSVVKHSRRWTVQPTNYWK